MKHARLLYLTTLVAPLPLGACAGEPAGPRVTVHTAALDYPGALDVCYALTVYNGLPSAPATDTVWSKDAICSTRYGNGAGGDISYVGTCDADVDGDNYVALTLESIRVDDDGEEVLLDDQITAQEGDGDADFENPCPASARCFLSFECVENADVAVDFDITVMRDAEQGFFDVAVNFEDVFCSAKVDSCTTPTEPITLLFGDDVADGPDRDHTAVAGIACTAGPDDVDHFFDTVLLFTTKTVTCDGGVSFTLDPVGEQGGNLTALSADGTFTLHYAHYFGSESLSCGQMNATNDEGALLFACDGGTCTITGLTPGRLPAGSGAGALPAGGYGGGLGGYPGYGAQQQQQQQAAGFGGGYGAGAAGAPLPPVQFFDSSGTEIFPTQGANGPILPEDWQVMSAPISCNKTYYDTAIDIENLAGQGLANCALTFFATAIASDDDSAGFETTHGTFAKAGGTYGAIHVDAVPLTGAASLGVVPTVCNAHPINGTDLYGDPSQVATQYVGTLAGTSPSFCFHSDDGDTLAAYEDCAPQVEGCPCWDEADLFDALESVRDFSPLRYQYQLQDAGAAAQFQFAGKPGPAPDYIYSYQMQGVVDAQGFCAWAELDGEDGAQRQASGLTKLEVEACFAAIEAMNTANTCPCWDVEALAGELAGVAGSTSYVADYRRTGAVEQVEFYTPWGSDQDTHALRVALGLDPVAGYCFASWQDTDDATAALAQVVGLSPSRVAACQADIERINDLGWGCGGTLTCVDQFHVERDGNQCAEGCTP